MRDQQRRGSLNTEMQKESFDALTCFAPEDVLLVSGYWPVRATSLAVLERNGSAHVVVPEDELELAKATLFDAKSVSYQPVALDRLSSVTDALEKPMRELLAQFGLGSGRVGLLQDTAQTQSYQLVNQFHRAIEPLLRKVCPGIPVGCCGAVLKRAKTVKIAAEIGGRTHLCGLAKSGFDAVREAIAVGRREDEIAADTNRTDALVAQDGFQRGEGYLFCMSRPNAAKASGAYARTRHRVVEDGDFAMIRPNTVGVGFGVTSRGPIPRIDLGYESRTCALTCMTTTTG